MPRKKIAKKKKIREIIIDIGAWLFTTLMLCLGSIWIIDRKPATEQIIPGEQKLDNRHYALTFAMFAAYVFMAIFVHCFNAVFQVNPLFLYAF